MKFYKLHDKIIIIHETNFYEEITFFPGSEICYNCPSREICYICSNKKNGVYSFKDKPIKSEIAYRFLGFLKSNYSLLITRKAHKCSLVLGGSMSLFRSLVLIKMIWRR